jgi:hypothetical protein
MTHRHGSPGRLLTPPAPPRDVVRYGPGVPGTRVRGQSGPPARPPRSRRLPGSALAVVLLTAAAVAVWLRFQHAPIQVTGVAITHKTAIGCGVDVSGRITTNGSAGTVSYQWVFQPQAQAPQPLNQTVTAGQHAVDVTVAVEGQGHGRAARTVILEVLGPDTGTASTEVVVSC